MSKIYTDETILHDALKKKDVKAFDYLYKTYRNRLFLLAKSILRDSEPSKDIIQEFFLDFWHNELYNKVKVSVKSYIYNAVQSRCLMHLRGIKAYARVLDTVTTSEYAETIYPLENSELKNHLDAAIGKLPPMASKVFKLHYIEQLSYLEIASLLGISKSTVGNHIDRALKDLRSTLKKNI